MSFAKEGERVHRSVRRVNLTHDQRYLVRPPPGKPPRATTEIERAVSFDFSLQSARVREPEGS
jgi:hypothetical protein